MRQILAVFALVMAINLLGRAQSGQQEPFGVLWWVLVLLGCASATVAVRALTWRDES